MRRNATKLWPIVIGNVLMQLSCASSTKTAVTQPTPQLAEPTVAQEKPSQELQLPAPLVVQQKPLESEKTLDRGVEKLAQQLTTGLPQEKKLLVAILDFNDLAGNVSAFGRLVNEELVTKLFQTQRVRIVERGLLDKALNELKFTLSGLVDPSRAKQLGKQVGADAIVTGTITDLGSLVKINARMIEVEKGDVLAVAGAEVSKDRVVGELMRQLLSGGPQVVVATEGVQQEEPSGAEVKETAASASAGATATSKKIEDMIITMKEVVVSSKADVRVMIDLSNQSDKDIKFALLSDPSLTDEKGNRFEFTGYNGRGVLHRGGFRWEGDGIALNAKSKGVLVLYFRPSWNIENVKEIGADFAVSFDYQLYNLKDKSESRHYSVSFADIKAQSPK